MIVAGALFRKYFALIGGLLTAVLLVTGVVEAVFTYRESEEALAQLARDKALAAAGHVEQSITEIVRQVGWTTLPMPEEGESALRRRRFELRNLLRIAPAVMEVRIVDASGHERVRVSRLEPDRMASGEDLSGLRVFQEARQGRDAYGPVRFVHETEPWMTVATTADPSRSAIGIADIDLTFVWDVVSRIRTGGASGYAYAVDAEGRLVAHPELSRVLGNTSYRGLAQVQAALEGRSVVGLAATNADGKRVFAAAAPVASLGWTVFVEEPVDEALAPAYAAAGRIAVLIVLGLLLAAASAWFLARRMSRPIEILDDGARRLAEGALEHRVNVRTGDELETLAERFNEMAEKLAKSHGDLEEKISMRTQELARANDEKSRFLAVASHDLRQPMHALGLFAAQLSAKELAPGPRKLAAGIEASVNALSAMLDSLLDLSRLHAGAVHAQIADFPAAMLLASIERTFEPTARQKGLRLRVRTSRVPVRSDAVLLERIVMNLVSNAVRYTARGGVLVAARSRGERVLIQVWDTGPGVPADRRSDLFSQSAQRSSAGPGRSHGLGLGLAIVGGLSKLVGAEVSLASREGRGSVFSITVPRGSQGAIPASPGDARDLSGRRVALVDDDGAALDGLRGLLESWGCSVLGAPSADELLEQLDVDGLPDVMIADFRLAGGCTGDAAVSRLRAHYGAEIPALLVSGDTSTEVLHAARHAGLIVLSKPVQPMKLRAMLTHLLTT